MSPSPALHPHPRFPVLSRAYSRPITSHLYQPLRRRSPPRVLLFGLLGSPQIFNLWGERRQELLCQFSGAVLTAAISLPNAKTRPRGAQCGCSPWLCPGVVFSCLHRLPMCCPYFGCLRGMLRSAFFLTYVYIIMVRFVC